MRTGVRLWAVLWLLGSLAAGPAGAAEDEAALPLAKQVDAAEEAFAKGDGERLRRLAAGQDAGAWMIADALVGRGNHEAAVAVAGIGIPGTEGLPAYVEARRAKPTTKERRERFEKAQAASTAGDLEVGLRALGEVGTDEDDVTTVRVLYGSGLLLRRMKRLPEAAGRLEDAAARAERIGWTPMLAQALHTAGVVREGLGQLDEACALGERAGGIYEALGDRAPIRIQWTNLAMNRVNAGQPKRALEFLGRVLGEDETANNRADLARAAQIAGGAHADLGEYERAIAEGRRAVGLYERAGVEGGTAKALGTLAATLRKAGDMAEAVATVLRAIAIQERAGDAAGCVKTYGTLGTIYFETGRYGESLAAQEKSLALAEGLGDARGKTFATSNLGLVHHLLGDHEEAEALLSKALEGFLALKATSHVASTRVNLGGLYMRMGRSEDAVASYEAAEALYRQMGAGPIADVVRLNLGSALLAAERHADAARVLEAATKALEGTARKGWWITARANTARALAGLGRVKEALEVVPREEEMQAVLGMPEAELGAYDALAQVRLAAGDPRGAAAAARRAVEAIRPTFRGLSDLEASLARSQWGAVFDSGIEAAWKAGLDEEVFWFLETGRAGALLEALGGGAALRDATLGQDLRDADAAARRAEVRAVEGLRRASETGEIAAIASAHGVLRSARAEREKVQGRIERTAKSVASLLDPPEPSLRGVQAALRAGEALVLYRVSKPEALALVVRRGSLSRVSLGSPTAIDAAVVAFSEGASGPHALAIAGRLRDAVVVPLGLSDADETVLVSPDGSLFRAPFALLIEDRPIAYVPSGATLRLLREGAGERGGEVLALGDPDYGDPRRLPGTSRAGDERVLPRLPFTAAEAEAVGDVVLLGPEATEAGLRARLAEPRRWRAVHLACHGRADSDHPMRSWLALTAAPPDDGLVTGLDVLGLRVRADLVVLSACETGGGAVYSGEGLLGLARAFMVAGAPRVLGSLWRVDDAATRELMTRFYAAWKAKPADGKPATGAAAALLAARRSLRSEERWAHPSFWASWGLSGLPE